jgi:hypothetical protein
MLVSLELVHHVRVHFRDFAARVLADKVVSNDIWPRKLALRVPDVAQECIEPGVHALLSCRVLIDITAGLLPVNPEQVIARVSLVRLARRVRYLDRALRRPVPFILAFGSERCTQATGVLTAERKPGLRGSRLTIILIVRVVTVFVAGLEIGVEVLVKDQKEFPAELPDLQVGEVPLGASVDDAALGFPELLQGLGHVPGAFRMADPKDEELRRITLEKESGIFQGRHQGAPILAKVAILPLLEEVTHRRRLLLLEDSRGSQEASDVKHA